MWQGKFEWRKAVYLYIIIVVCMKFVWIPDVF
jgi:hypothetical protein